MNFMEEKEKMKIGDLVMLSAYGRKRKRAEWIARDDVGLVIRVIEYHAPQYPPDYEVKWTKSNYSNRSRRWHHERHNTRADLRYAK